MDTNGYQQFLFTLVWHVTWMNIKTPCLIVSSHWRQSHSSNFAKIRYCLMIMRHPKMSPDMKMSLIRKRGMKIPLDNGLTQCKRHEWKHLFTHKYAWRVIISLFVFCGSFWQTDEHFSNKYRWANITEWLLL